MPDEPKKIARTFPRRFSIIALSFFSVSFGVLGVMWTLRSDAAPGSQTITFTQSTSAPENPMRGFYEWREQNIIQTNATPTEAYDRYWWNDLETSKNTYKMSGLINNIKNAEAKGQRYAFRIRALSGKQTTDYSSESKHIPQYMIDEGCARYDALNGGTGYGLYMPKWENACFTDRMDSLLKAINDAIKGNQLQDQIAYVDIGVYGQWGEWTLYGTNNAAAKAPNSALRNIVDSHIKHFGNYRLLMFVGADKITGDTTGDPLVYAMNQTPENNPALKSLIGLRADCVDCKDYLKGKSINSYAFRAPYWLDRWQTAPLITETGAGGSAAHAATQIPDYHVSAVGNGNITDLSAANRASYVAAVAQSGYQYRLTSMAYQGDISPSKPLDITLNWTNGGVAPTYENWKVTLQLRRSGEVIAESDVNVDLNSMKSNTLNSTSASTTSLNMPVTLAGGDYEIYLKITDPKNVRPAMKLANTISQQTDGSYALATTTHTTPTPSKKSPASASQN